MISIQTNVDSLMAQRNLNVDNTFQSNTIQQLTSGYRINSSGDDAAGLAIANGYRSSITELNQGVQNANDGVSQLQIIDGGLSNISTILDRLKTLATESASSTFTGSRATLNQEYSGLLNEVDRQASNINLNNGGTFNSVLNVYIGGASTASNATVSVDLSGAQSAVDSTSLGLAGSNVLGGGVDVTGNTQRIDATGATFVKGVAGTDDQTFSFNLYSPTGGAKSVTATVAASTNGSSLSSVLSSLNSQLNSYGISAGVDNNGLLQFSGSTAFTVKDNGTIGSGTQLLTNDSAASTTYTSQSSADALTITNAAGTATTVNLAANATLAQAITAINAQTTNTGVTAAVDAAGTGITFQGAVGFSVADAGSALGAAIAATTTVGGGLSENTSNYIVDGQGTYSGTNAQKLSFQTSAGSTTVSLAANTNLATAISQINSQTASLGLYAIENSTGTGISFQSANSFSVNGSAAGVFAAGSLYNAATAPTGGTTNNATSAISAINNAIQSLGLVQGRVGAGENTLNYAINLAQSQITSYSAAEAQIRDADVASDAANLTKAQVLTQTSVAALAQANSEPQAILKLLQ